MDAECESGLQPKHASERRLGMLAWKWIHGYWFLPVALIAQKILLIARIQRGLPKHAYDTRVAHALKSAI